MSKFLYNPKFCSGCWACTMACADENDLVFEAREDMLRLVSPREYDGKGNLILSWRMEGCMHCDRPACVEACPAGALRKNENGYTQLDREACIGCGACVKACPFHAVHISAGKAVKCHGCQELTENGLVPPCVKICPTKAFFLGK